MHLPPLPSRERAQGSVLRWHLPMLFAPLLVLVMLGLVYLYSHARETQEAEKQRHAFEMAADRIAYNLKDRMDAYELVLRGVKGYFDGSESIERDEFRAYIDALQLEEKRPGLQGVSLLLWVKSTDVPLHAEAMRKKGFAAYSIWPQGPRAHYAAITHIEPFAGDNLKALGFDAATVPGSRAALELARDSGQLALTGKLDLVQNEGRGRAPALVMYLPLYGKQEPPDSLQGRRDSLVGWVAAQFRMRSVLQGLARELDTDIGLEIYDGDTAAPQALLYSTATAVSDADSDLQATRRIALGGRHWTLRMHPLAGFEHYHPPADAWFATMGVGGSLVLGWLAWLLATGRERALALARGMTQELRSTRDDLESTLSAVPDLLFEVDLQGVIHHVRSARTDLLVAPPEALLGKRFTEILTPGAAASCMAALQQAHAHGLSRGQEYELELAGESHWFELSVARKEGGTGSLAPRFIALSRDITERKQAQAHTHRLAYYDALTGLPNRRLLLDRTHAALAAHQASGEVGALLFVDLDNFKQINDARGHSVGDVLLVQVAQRLQRLQGADATVARLGGDEFVVLVSRLAPDLAAGTAAAQQMAERVRAVLEAPHRVNGHVYDSSASIGITLFPRNCAGVEDLLREADTAMYRAKAHGRNRIAFYEPAMLLNAQESLALEQDLKSAMARNELVVHVQSQVDASGRVVGGELLLRWNHPQRGSVPPDRFIAVAEESGLILRLGDWVLLQACEALAQLHAVGSTLLLSVNVSTRQFRQDDFVERVRGMIARTGAPASQLILEVTESLFIDNWQDTSARMAELVQLGIRFSIDDFGTGYSSLAYLKKLPLFELKIDKGFVQDTPDDPNGTAIVQSILSVARHLKLRVVAEGVETRAQADFLTANGCEFLQGYWFERPGPLQPWLQRRLGASD
ncbi:bifunctional diguanylate cyclase/phosphodiesterase [Rhodococcus sp. SRB_17]|uniref:bifunctional diguanylate cyclase/phosphodiesterase n=1 Tax=Acidovorax sp. SRB_24 TaxID=1962700 RepID=UPI001ECAD67E|nr:EAL domain-containing protein [Acidovorax sp. SRB_24]NMM77039.1 bifunctional diguanylate cyclase/phosphodiesterase [Acidovorax sp. SRB_24]NMM84729.1 bifunctional diguanylate cyclase/phosphodiesterase [Rhodococcus sp. SRB_17]